ncbi:MAG TPA: M43 family zinc metalloprotease, partial [Pseudobdellovibrionaceae bacterium]|nr:M43 family zinc metalloprotease [Pseudobdellovibrionaceae bacterium]
MWCGTSKFTENEKRLYYEILKKSESSKKGRKGATYELYIKPKVLHSSLSPLAITTDQVLELVNKLNLVFSEINIRFLVENNEIQHIYDNEFYDLKTESDGKLRAKYDGDDAINLYFTHTITRPDLSLLNGYTSLPNFSKRSNAIVLSYLDNDPVSFSLLKEKIVPHEFGHYFGLLHTYHDSNNSDIKKRELVTRGIGANCTTTGDELCDTPADPFERHPSLISLDCTEKIPSDIIDFNGESYSPPLDNYMSYHHKCGQKFTPMQFQRMESGLNIRLSSFAEYKITKNVSNFLSITDLNKKIYCKGDSIIATFQKTGLFDSKNEFKVEISDKTGGNFREISGYKISSDKQIKIHIDQSWENGSNYRLIITSTLPYTESPLSESFEIKSLPSAEISSSQNSLQKGEELQLNLKFGGSGPWNFK